jgi:hypothetical protein
MGERYEVDGKEEKLCIEVREVGSSIQNVVIVVSLLISGEQADVRRLIWASFTHA